MKQSNTEIKTDTGDPVADPPQKSITIKTELVTKFIIRQTRSNGASFGWADIVLDTEGPAAQKGRMTIVSDFGDWSYYWGSCGMEFRRFLIQLDMSYMAHKFNESSEFRADTTIRQIKKDVIQSRRDGADKDFIRKVWDEVETLDSFAFNCRTTNEFTMGILAERLDELADFYDDWMNLPVDTDISRRFQNFWSDVWIPFCEHLKVKLEEETELMSMLSGKSGLEPGGGCRRG